MKRVLNSVVLVFLVAVVAIPALIPLPKVVRATTVHMQTLIVVGAISIAVLLQGGVMEVLQSDLVIGNVHSDVILVEAGVVTALLTRIVKGSFVVVVILVCVMMGCVKYKVEALKKIKRCKDASLYCIVSRLG